MRIVGNQVPMGTLLYNIGGDTNKAVSLIRDATARAGINMTPGELNLLGIVAAEASAYQQDPSFQRKVALEMLKENSQKKAWTAASETLWQEATNRVIAHGIADDISRDIDQKHQAEAIDTEEIPGYDKENSQEVWENGSGEANQDILRRENSMGDSGGRSEDTGTIREGDSILPREGIPEGGSGGDVSLSGSGGITDYDDDFVHFDGRAGVDTEGKSIPEESAKRLLGTTVVDDSGAPTPLKYTGFFLKPDAKHADQFFDVGYTQDNPLRLRYDMAQQFDMAKAVDVITLEGGAVKFNIYMELGITKKRTFRTCWRIDTPGGLPRIVTAFRNDGGKES